MILLLLSFIAGVLTVLAPCTISLLPVIVGGSIGGGTNLRRALTVTGSLGVSVILFTLILKVSTAFITVPQSFWQILSGVIIFGLGLTMIFPSLWDKLPWVNKMNQESNKLLATGYNKQNFTGDVLMGAALGPVFSSCSPTYFLILATVLPRSLGEGIIYLMAYAIGLCGSLLVITLAGQKLFQRLGVASDPNGWIKRTIGIIFLIIGVFIAIGYDQKIEASLTTSGYFDVTTIEQKLLAKELAPKSEVPNPANISTASGTATLGASDTTASGMPLTEAQRILMKNLRYQKAPEITDPSGFINTGGQPITIGQFKEKKVVLIDFWTYSCINCQRTLPYLKAWNAKYASEGLEIISIHTPEFGFEKVMQNVQNAVTAAGITYPVVMDNNYATWNAFGNEFWPNTYLIDTDGYIVYSHAGEGDDDVTEAAIQQALAERAQILGLSPSTVSTGTVAPADAVSMDSSKVGSPETYFGSNRNEYLGNGQQGAVGTQNLTIPANTQPNTLYLGGSWNFQPEFAEANDANEKIVYTYTAKNLYFVASSSSANGTRAKILIDGQPISAAMAGSDVGADGTVLIQANRLYNIVSATNYGQHTIEIDPESSGLDAYTFTFG